MRRPIAFLVILRSSLWFVPTLVVLGSIIAAHGLAEAGLHIPALSQSHLPSIFGFGPEGSRAMLSAIATAMITVAGVAFSITIVALSLASTQYSPRVLRQFMRDRANQWVLGIFVGVFTYCLTLLPRVRGGDDSAFVPALAVAFGVVYALIGVGCLIFFIHHVATSIQASCIVSEIAAETRASAAQLFPDELAANEDERHRSDEEEGEWQAIPAPASGYIQLIEDDELVRIAVACDVVLRMERAVGDFVVAGAPIASMKGRRDRHPEVSRKVAGVFTLDHTRTVEQDVMFGIRQIVDVALRALSPSLNDPTTAIHCVDYLTTILCQLATRRMGDAQSYHEGILRTIKRPPSFPVLVQSAFGELRLNGKGHPTVLNAVLRALETVADVTVHSSRRGALRAEALAVRESLIGDTSDPSIDQIRTRAERLVARLT